MKKFLLLCAVIISISARGAIADSPGYYFYKAFNKAMVSYYIDNRYDSFKKYTDIAFEILPHALYTPWYEAACIYAREKDYRKAAVFFSQSIRYGMDPRFLGLEDDSARYAGFLRSKEYTVLRREKDSLYGVFKANLDVGFIQEIFWDIGADQVFRGGKVRGKKAQECSRELGYIIDSVNYASLKDYIKEHGFPDFRRLDYVTKNTFNVIMNHYIPSPLDSMNGNFFLNLFNRKLMEGEVPNTFITPALDYKSLLRKGKQLYGTYGYMDTAHKYNFNPFLNADSIDTWRSSRCLPPLYLDYKQSPNVILPEGYHYKRN
ncbi:hypothetical protein ACTHGU_14460 [Chitinophagaceae bacterium MMS25-I14]